MRIHKEGHTIIAVSAVVILILAFVVYGFLGQTEWLQYGLYALLVLFFVWVVYFFRSPGRRIPTDPRAFLSPADGRVVLVQQTHEEEHFGQPMQQVSVFMSPLNVHLNRFPTDGRVVRSQYHPGKYLVAWHPKSSSLNEHNSIVLETPGGIRYMVRQIAGVLARRIVCYCEEGKQMKQGGELGFIRFGSRLDLFVPLEADVTVRPGDKVRGGQSVLAYMPGKS